MSQRHNGDYYILPSSKYEVIVIPADEAPPQKELLQMVSEINSTVLDPQDVLSDRIYLVTHDTLAIKAIRAASIKEDNDLIQSKTAKPVLAM